VDEERPDSSLVLEKIRIPPGAAFHARRFHVKP
jgi:hypothetical protein